jgi:hypothetical protein
MVYTSYSTIPFIALSQTLLFYRAREDNPKTPFSSLFILNGTLLLLCIPWFLFIISNYKGQSIMDPFTIQDIGPFSSIIQGMLNDWAPHLPLTVVSATLLILFPFFSKNKKNALILLSLLILPVLGLYLYCRLLNVTQFITSRYFIDFLPLFLVTLFLSLHAIEGRVGKLKRLIRPMPLFLILFIASNLFFLPLYYHSEKQDFRGLVNYLNSQLRNGDRIFVRSYTYLPGILHYFGINPMKRHYEIPFEWKVPGKEFEFRVSLNSENRAFTIYHSNICCAQYVADGNRLWIVVGKEAAEEIKKSSSLVLKGYFDGSFANFRRFPSDASMYLFLWDPLSSEGKGILIPDQ